MNMGFGASLAEQVTLAAEGNFDAALEQALDYVPPPPPPPPAAALVKTNTTDSTELVWEEDWDCLLDELVEMGFENPDTNKRLVAANQGDLKSTVTALISEERADRQPHDQV